MSTGLNILVVDDVRDHADSLADLFRLEDHEVTVAYNGADAIAAFKNVDFDIAFMDVLMPKMNGVESFLEIKKIKPNAQVIMMTGYSVDQLLHQATDNGAVGVLHKPLDPKTILDSVEKLVPSGIVLVNDTDKNLGPTLQKMLGQGGLSCKLLTDGKEAVSRLENCDFDALVLDLDIPLIDGLGVYKSLKAANIDVPTIMISEFADTDAEGSASDSKLEFTGVLTKPFDLEDLLEKLPSLARNSRQSSDDTPANTNTSNNGAMIT